MPQTVTDAEVVEATFRNISDADAFDDMLTAWGKRLEDQLTQGNFAELSPEMRGHVEQALEQLRHNIVGASSDPIDREVDVPTATMVLSPEGIVVAVNAAGTSAFSASQGRQISQEWIEERSSTQLRSLLDGAKQGGNRKHAILRYGPGNTALAEAFEINAGSMGDKLIVVRSLEAEWAPHLEVILGEAFGLTHAECEVAWALFSTLGWGILARPNIAARPKVMRSTR